MRPSLRLLMYVQIFWLQPLHSLSVRPTCRSAAVAREAKHCSSSVFGSRSLVIEYNMLCLLQLLHGDAVRGHHDGPLGARDLEQEHAGSSGQRDHH